MSVAVGGFHFEHTVTQFHDGYIECTAAEVVHCDLHILVLLVKAVCQSGCRRLVDDTLYIQTGDLSCLFCSLSL